MAAEHPLPRNRQPAHVVALRHQRWQLLRHFDQALHKPLIALSFVWLVLLIVDFTHGLNTPLLYLIYGIWAVFALDFVVEFIIAPHKLTYLRTHWLSVIALLLPGLRVLAIVPALQIFVVAGTVRPAGLLRLVTALNRGMGALGQTLGRRGFGFVVAFTIIVIFASAGAISYYESPAALHAAGYPPGTGLHGYLDSLWWTAMMMTTMGSDYWPKTTEGRVLAFVLALYAFAMFGYITATLASYFVHSDGLASLARQERSEERTEEREIAHAATSEERQVARTQGEDQSEVAALRAEIAELRVQMATLLARLDGHTANPNAPASSRDPAHT